MSSALTCSDAAAFGEGAVMTELSFDDLDHVSGGPKPLVLIAAFGSGAVLGAALVVGVYYLIK